MLKKRRVHLWWMEHKMKVLIAVGVVVLLVLTVVGLMSLESFYRNITLAQMPVGILMGAVHAVMFVWLYSVVLMGRGSGGDKKAIKSEEVNVKFDDVVGIDEAKEEAREVVDLLKDHTKLQAIGGKIVKGILMVGPPGCGKTYLAKAIASECGLPFISAAATEFNEMYVGVGASRVRKLFKKARMLAYGYGGCVIFIDEMDAMGKKRTFNQFGSGEGNTTQNQLLIEMDGVGSTGDNVIVIGATNASEDVLDDALLRPGRFDRKIYIRKPNLTGRSDLLKLYLAKVKHDPNLSVNNLAKRTVGYSPAEIENLIKEAALIATRDRKEMVEYGEVTEALERVELGAKNRFKATLREKEMTAYHEAGHLITTYLLSPTDDVFKASIIPRKNTLGVVHHQPREEILSHDRHKLYADIKTALAGYAAEKIQFGTTTTGVGSDFKKASKMAHVMVWQLGMAENEDLIGDFTAIPQEQLSEELKCQLNKETNIIIKNAMKDVEALLEKHKDVFERFAKELLQREELEYDDIEAIFKEYGIDNPRKDEDWEAHKKYSDQKVNLGVARDNSKDKG